MGTHIFSSILLYFTNLISFHLYFKKGFNSEAFRYMRDERGEPRTMREPATNEPILTDSLGYRIPEWEIIVLMWNMGY